MNRTQRWAWVMAAGSLVGVALTIKGLAGTLAGESMPVAPCWELLWMFVLCVAAVLALRKKRPAEVDSDERDELIKARAARVAAGSGIILLVAANIFSTHMAGPDGSIPVRALSEMTAVGFCIAIFVYSVAILIQYGRGGRDGD